MAIALDAVSNRTELRATIGSTPDFKNTYTYDKLKRLTDIVQTGQVGGNAVVAKHIMQAFNAANQRTNITRYQSSGTANLVASTNFTFDTVGRLDGIQHLRQGAINLNSYSYTYDGMSRLSNVTSTAEGTATFSYDSSSQLKSAIGTQPAESYAYDDNGNRNTTGYVTGTDNRTTSDPNFNYQYDAEGNLIRKTSKTNSQDDTLYQYDHRNRLTRVQFGPLPGVSNYVAYEYDGFNRLVRRFSVPAPSYVSETTYWIYDEGINPVLEVRDNTINGNGYVTHRYLWSNSVDDLLADEQVNPSNNTANTLFPLSDHLGSIRDIADFDEATGITAIANHRRYDSFGKMVNETGTADIAFGYTGKLYDKKTGLQNNWNRWYDPNLGKWISQDPMGFAAGDPNLYRYVGNDPQNWIDPSGLHEVEPSSARPHRYPINIPWVDEFGAPHWETRPYLPLPPEPTHGEMHSESPFDRLMREGRDRNAEFKKRFDELGEVGRNFCIAVATAGRGGSRMPLRPPAPGIVPVPLGIVKLNGSGNAPGIFEIGARAKSTAVVRQQLSKGRLREFVYLPDEGIFAINKRLDYRRTGERFPGSDGFSAHSTIRSTLPESNKVVGGNIRCQNGKYVTDELSGHYGRNWTADIRDEFTKFMKDQGFEVVHDAF